MYFQSEFARRFTFPRNPGGIVIGYIVTLLAIAAGVAAFPYSRIWIGLLIVVVGAFLAVAVTILVVVYLFFITAFFAALMNLGRRLLYGTDRWHESRTSSQSALEKKGLESLGTCNDLWDRWIDGLW
jgi:hypothetical protein